MKFRHLSSSVGLMIGVLGGTGCVTDGASIDPDHIASAFAPIQGGQLETGFPAVGQVLLGNGSFCSGTLIAPSYVLTAAHCAGAGMVFNTGTDASNFISHAVDQQLTHPTLDLLIAHLASPIAGAPLSVIRKRACPETPLFCADCFHRIDSGDSAGGQIASKECRNHQG